MDAQLKKGSLDICVLSSLLKEDSYGYKIIQDLENVVVNGGKRTEPLCKQVYGFKGDLTQ